MLVVIARTERGRALADHGAGPAAALFSRSSNSRMALTFGLTQVGTMGLLVRHVPGHVMARGQGYLAACGGIVASARVDRVGHGLCAATGRASIT